MRDRYTRPVLVLATLAALASTLGACSSGDKADPVTGPSTTPSSTSAAPPSVEIAKGPSAQGKAGCSAKECAQVVVSTRGFTGQVKCRISKAFAGTAGFIAWSQDGNETYQTPNYYGYPNGWLVVTCAGVASAKFSW